MKKVVYALIVALVVVSGLVYANRKIKNKPVKVVKSKPLTATDMEKERKKWEASPDGVMFKGWAFSAAGEKVRAGIDHIKPQINAFTDMEAVVTSLTLPAGSKLGHGVMVRVNNFDYILTFDAEKNQLEQLHQLKVNDKLTIRSRSVFYAPKYAFPIVAAEYVAQGTKVIFKRIARKDGC